MPTLSKTTQPGGFLVWEAFQHDPNTPHRAEQIWPCLLDTLASKSLQLERISDQCFELSVSHE